MRKHPRISGIRLLLVIVFLLVPFTQTAAQVSGIPPVTGKIEKYYGIRYIDLVVGTGQPVVRAKCVYAHYTGWLKDGSRFESSRDSVAGDPPTPVAFVFGIRHVMEGWDLGFNGMKTGGRRRLMVPFKLAYGEAGRAPIPPRADLTFDVEVMGVSEPLPRPPNIRRDVLEGLRCPPWSEVATRNE